MIRFRCRCDEPFEVPSELAGTSFQCPNCGLLVDVPTIDDLPGLEAGGYKLHETPIDFADEHEPARRAVGTGGDTPHVAVRGDAKDRRLSLSEFLNIGVSDDDLLQIKGESVPGVSTHPKYDPFTGELVVPLDVKTDPKVVAAAVPIAASPAVLGYERKAPEGRVHGLWWPIFEMFRAPNMFVCVIVSVAYYIDMVAFGALAVFILPLALILPVFMMTVAHFANIIDETGPTAVDEIPRPLRSGNIYEDFLRPLVQVFFAYFIAWLPVLLFNHYVKAFAWAVDLGFLAIFFTLVPALMITLTTSGAVNNLLPQRSLSVISASGRDYWVATLTGILATLVFAFASLLAINGGNNVAHLAFSNQPGSAFVARPIFPIPMFVESLATPAVMFVAIYLVHVFCWQMGLIYRRHHEQFNWVLQKHDKSARSDTLAQLHTHRQKVLEAKAEQARKRMEKRGVAGATAALPVAKPVNQR